MGKEGSATRQLGDVSVALVGWANPANKHVRRDAMACSVKACAAVRMGLYVTLLMGPASVDWAGLDPTVTQPAQRTNMALIVQQTVCVLTMGPVTASPAAADVLLATMGPPVNMSALLGIME